QTELEVYRAIMDRHGNDLTAAQAEITAAAANVQDDMTLMNMKMGKFDRALQIWNARQTHLDNLSIAQSNLALRQEIERGNLTARQQAADELKVWRDTLAKESDARIKQGQERLDLQAGKAIQPVQAKITDLTSLDNQLDELVAMAKADPSLLGAKGWAR